MKPDMRPDGGFAFPGFHIDNGVTTVYGGLSLRDWFAGMALIGIAEEYGSSPEQRAERCYRFADAMLAQREKP